jgi:hypothetical protein
MTTVYDDLYTLADLVFIGGTDKVLTFTCYAENGIDLLNLTSGVTSWRLCPYGEFSVNTLTKTGSISSPGTLGVFTITLDAADTLLLNGKFIQQAIIQDFSGNTFRQQGVVIISPAIPE